MILDHIKPTILNNRDLDALISKLESYVETLPFSERALYNQTAIQLKAYRSSIVKMRPSLKSARTSLDKIDNGKVVLVPSVRELVIDFSTLRNVGVNQ